jgi:hypothetical protein
MKSYTVVWNPTAERQLTEFWLACSNRAEVTGAADEIDRRLAIDPSNEGESRNAGRRVLILKPLVVIFRVHEADRIVKVSQVRLFKLRR